MLVSVGVALILADNGVDLPGEIGAGALVAIVLVPLVLRYQRRSYLRLEGSTTRR